MRDDAGTTSMTERTAATTMTTPTTAVTTTTTTQERCETKNHGRSAIATRGNPLRDGMRHLQRMNTQEGHKENHSDTVENGSGKNQIDATTMHMASVLAAEIIRAETEEELSEQDDSHTVVPYSRARTRPVPLESSRHQTMSEREMEADWELELDRSIKTVREDHVERRNSLRRAVQQITVDELMQLRTEAILSDFNDQGHRCRY